MLKQPTLRLLLPQWQGGMNPNYVLGAQLLSVIAPPSESDELVTIDVPTNFDAGLQTEYGVDRFAQLMKQVQETSAVLKEKQPDKVITFGGDCAVSQAPFAYLAEKYGDKLGVLWLDAHPDITDVKDSSHLHEMVMANLLGEGSPEFANLVPVKIPKTHLFYAGLIEKDLREMDQRVVTDAIKFATPEEIGKDSQVILDWISETGIDVLAVHFDLDVLNPYDFKSIYPAEPSTKVEDFPAAVGELTLNQIVRILSDIEPAADLVGLSITEHLPWDAFNLRNALSKISIFRTK